jgi:hypothetical protein
MSELSEISPCSFSPDEHPRWEVVETAAFASRQAQAFEITHLSREGPGFVARLDLRLWVPVFEEKCAKSAISPPWLITDALLQNFYRWISKGRRCLAYAFGARSAVYTLIHRRDHPGGWLTKFKCEIREIREISPAIKRW